MQISIAKPGFSKDFKDRIARARGKGCSLQVNYEGKNINVIVSASARPVGKFSFTKEDDTCILHLRFIIEREYCPFEFAISGLIKELKKKGIKFILWN